MPERKPNVLMINVNPDRPSTTPEIDDIVKRYHQAKEAVGTEGGDQRHEPNNGLLSLGRVLLDNGCHVTYLDLNAKEIRVFRTENRFFSQTQIFDIVKSYSRNIDIVMVSVLTPNIHNSIEIIRQIKSWHPKCRVIVGGVFATLNPEYCMVKCPQIDVLVIGEAEDVILRIVDACYQKDLSLLKDIKGICFRKPGQDTYTRHEGHHTISDFTRIGLPAYELLEEESKPFVFRLFMTRGCSSACSFCSPSFVCRHKINTVKPEKVIDLLIELKEKFNPEFLVIGDLTFFDNEEQSRDILRLMIDRQINIPFWCQTRMDRINKINLELLSRAGCRQVALGIESYNDSVLAMIRKGIQIEQMVKKLIQVKQFGLQVQGYFIVGLPDETPQNINRTIKFVEYSIDSGYLDLTHISIYVPYPGLPVPPGITIVDVNYDHYFQGVFLDMQPFPVCKTQYLDQKSTFQLWLKFLKTVTAAYDRRQKQAKDLTGITAQRKTAWEERPVVLGAEALAVVTEISHCARAENKKSVFNIVQGIRKKSESFVSKRTHTDDQFVIGDAEIYSLSDLEKLIATIDGQVDILLLDVDIKNKLSKAFIDLVHENVKLSTIQPYSDIDVWCKAVIMSLLGRNIMLARKDVCLLSRNKVSAYMEKMLHNFGANVFYAERTVQEKNPFDLLINFSFGGQTMDKALLERISHQTTIIDATGEGISSDIYDRIIQMGLTVERPEMRPALSAHLSLAQLYGRHMETKGHLHLDGYSFVSGGIVGERGDVVVDSIRCPRKILGLADGQGKIIKHSDMGEADIHRLKKASQKLIKTGFDIES